MAKRNFNHLEQMLVVKEMAHIARVSEKTILRAIKGGELKAVRVGGGYKSTPRQFRQFLRMRAV